jgi:glycosyltransferase involved in cell wall biosynthesis
MPEQIFSVHIDVYYGLSFFRQALENIRNQTYSNIEIIISNNGSLPEIQDFIKEQAQVDSRIKVINYERNLYNPKDPMFGHLIMFHDALEIAKGEFFYYQSYDDLMALDYIEKMVKLFNEDEQCMSAAGLPISIYADNRIEEEELINRTTNLRPRMMDGVDLALDSTLDGNYFSAPGTIFSFRTKFLREKGGFHKSTELSQLYGIVPFGKTGFDETAIFYWRRGDFQLNKILTNNGWCGVQELYDLLKDFDLYNRWLEFGEIHAINVVNYCKRTVCRNAAEVFLINLAELRFVAVMENLKIVFFKQYFWLSIPRVFWNAKKYFIYTLYQSIKNVILFRRENK